MNLIPFREIHEEDEFWRGARFIKKGTGLNNINSDEDFFEYILISDSSSKDYMICCHIDEFEAGAIISHVKTTLPNSNSLTVTAKEFKLSNILEEEIDSWYYHKVENDRYWNRSQKGILEKLKRIDLKGHFVDKVHFDTSYYKLDIYINYQKSPDYALYILRFEGINEIGTSNIIFDCETYMELLDFTFSFSELFACEIKIASEENRVPTIEIKLKCEKIDLIKY